MRGRGWMRLVLLRAVLTAVVGLGMSCGWAQTKLATVPLKQFGAMTAGELDQQHPIPNPPPDRVGWTTSGPSGGIAWQGVGAVAVDGKGHVYVGLPIWASGYAPKNAVRGQGDKLRVLVVNAAGKGAVERTMDFPTKSLGRVDLRLAGDGTLLVLADDKLMRVGGDGKPTAELKVPNEEKEYEVWDVESSATGRTLRLRLNEEHTLLVDAETLTVLKQCHGSKDVDEEGTMTDDLELASRVETTEPKLTYGLERKGFCEKRERLGEFGDIDFVPSVLDDGQFLAIARTGIALRKLSGETVWTTKAPAGRVLGKWEGEERLSQDGRRVAMRLFKEMQYHEPDTMNPEDIRNGTWNRVKTVEVQASIGVWDVASGRLVGQAPLPAGDASNYTSANAQFGLSPDGRTLAVVQDGVLTVWRME